jgi:hypothetical protein
VVATSCEEGSNNRDTDDSNEELIATAESDFKCQSRLPMDHFEKPTDVTCPNHTYPVKHKLKEFTLVKNYMRTRTFARSKKPKGDSAGKAAAPFLEEKVIMYIYGGPHAGRSTPRVWQSQSTCSGLNP